MNAPASTLAPPAISEGLLREIEEALAVYQVACDDYECGLVGITFCHRRWSELETLCLAAGMSPGQDCEGFARGVVS